MIDDWRAAPELPRRIPRVQGGSRTTVVRTDDRDSVMRPGARRLQRRGAVELFAMGWHAWCAGWLVGCWLAWLVGCVVGWLCGWLVGRWVGWLVGWLVACLVGWLVGWLIVWLVGWLID